MYLVTLLRHSFQPFLPLCALVHPFSCCLKSARQKWGGAVTPLPQICELAGEWGNVGTRPYPASAVRKHALQHYLSSVRQGQQTGEWPLTPPAAECCSTRQECVCTSLPTTSQREGEEAVENTHSAQTQTACVCSPQPLCYGLHSVAPCERRGECSGSESDGWVNLKGHTERDRRCVRKKAGR